MNKINWQTALATAGLTVTGVMGAVFTSYQLLESSYRLPTESLLQSYASLKEETDALLVRTELLRDQVVHGDAQLREICHLIKKEENLSEELRNYCFNLITRAGSVE